MDKKKRRILIIDDEEPVREAVQYILESEDYAVTTCREGAAGIREVEKSDFDLIISDIVMPDMDGIGFLREIRTIGKAPPVIVMSGNKLGRQFLKSANYLGAKMSLTKPFSKTELLEAVEKLLSE